MSKKQHHNHKIPGINNHSLIIILKTSDLMHPPPKKKTQSNRLDLKTKQSKAASATPKKHASPSTADTTLGKKYVK